MTSTVACVDDRIKCLFGACPCTDEACVCFVERSDDDFFCDDYTEGLYRCASTVGHMYHAVDRRHMGEEGYLESEYPQCSDLFQWVDDPRQVGLPDNCCPGRQDWPRIVAEWDNWVATKEPWETVPELPAPDTALSPCQCGATDLWCADDGWLLACGSRLSDPRARNRVWSPYERLR